MEMLILFLKGDKSKIDICTVKESDIARHWATDAEEEMLERVQGCIMMGSILATRLPEENYHGIVDFIEAFRPDTTNYGIKRRLVSLEEKLNHFFFSLIDGKIQFFLVYFQKYLYVHVPRPTIPCNSCDEPKPISTWLDGFELK